MSRRGRLFIVSAPSGTGKTTLVDRLVELVPGLVRSRSYTARPMRPGEVDRVDYNFVEASHFREMIDAGAFLEWAEVFGRLYGTGAADTERHRAAGRDVVLVIDVQGARQVRSRVDAVGIFILPPSFSELERRLHARTAGASPEDLARRLETARREVEMSGDYDYVVVNDDIDDCVERLRQIVLAERSSAAAMADTVRAVADTFHRPGRRVEDD
ncbi:MAG: guanylate kinase [Acidobacteria bacterium]|nr:guanylate kinase [Acidobacteriota bacterium]